MKFCNQNILKTATYIVISLMCCNLSIAQDQNNTKSKTSTIDATNDSLYTDNGNKIVNGKDIETTVNYVAEDSIVYDLQSKQIYLHGKSSVNYGTRTLGSDKIIIDYVKNSVTSIGTPDSVTKKTKGRPVFKEGSETYVADKIVFNFATKKGVVYGAETKQGEGFIYGEAIKKNGDDELFVKNALYTTCDRKHAHFGFLARKIKIITNKKILSGPGQIQIGGTNLPIYLPFGFFPYPKTRSSGILMPAIAGTSETGKYLQNVGFYWAINDYMGLKVASDVFFNGGYRGNLQFDYKVNYRFAGSFGFEKTRIIKGFGETKVKQAPQNRIMWTHRQLAKRRGTFSANVNIVSSGFVKQNATPSINQYSQSDFNSSVNYTRNFPKSGLSMNLASRYANNTATKTTQIDLPTLNLGLPNLKPFQKIGKSGKLPLLQNVNISPGLEMSNKLNPKRYKPNNQGILFENKSNLYYDSLTLQNFTLDKFAEYSNYGARWNLGIYTDAKVLKYFNLRPNASFSGTLYDKAKTYVVNTLSNDLAYKNVKGLYAPFTYNFGLTASTVVYGMIKPKILGVKAIRHVMTPNVSYTVQPNIDKSSAYYRSMFQQNPLDTNQYVSRFSNSVNGIEYVYGAPTSSTFSEVYSFNITNTFEAKVRNRKDTSGTNKDKKVKLLDNIGLSASYYQSNVKYKMSNIILVTSTRFLNKLNLNANLAFDPYTYSITEKDGKKTAVKNDEYLISKFDFKKNNYLAELRTISLNASTSLNPKFKYKNVYTPEEEAFFRMYPHLRYSDFSLPWNVSINYAFLQNREVLLKPKTTSTINIASSITLLESWKLTHNVIFNTETKKWSGNSITVNKDLHCWYIYFKWSPFNDYATYEFTIKAKASTLSGVEPFKKNGTSAF